MPQALAPQVRALIRELQEKTGSLNAVAKAAKKSESGLRAFMNGDHSNIGIDTLQNIIDALDAPMNIAFDGQEKHRALALRAPVLFNDESYAAIPVYDIRASAGPGAMNDPHGEPLFYYPFPIPWLGAVTRAGLEFLAMIRVDGDSMEPTLFNGDYVLINRAIRQVGRDGIYALRYSDWDELRIKRCVRQARTKLLTIKSDNPIYPPEEGVSDDDIAVDGRAVWLSRNIGG